jgi:hypothetical protein
MAELEPKVGPPSGGNRPPAPPVSGKPERGPDPFDPGPPINVFLDDLPFGDLGNGLVDARLVTAVLLLEGVAAGWLTDHGVTLDRVERAFPGSSWPIEQRPNAWPQFPDPSTSALPIRIRLDDLDLGALGHNADAPLLWAIAARGGRVGEWLRAQGITAIAVNDRFPRSAWR